MASAKNIQSVLDQKMKDVREAPEGFGFYVSLHDFVDYIESTPTFATFFSGAKRGSRASEIPLKYSVMKQIRQGIEDMDIHTTKDLGHDRYVAIRELSSIKKNDVSNNIAFWKHRETLRNLTGEIHAVLCAHLSESGNKK